MAGGSVAGLLERHGVFTEGVMVRYLVQVLLALDYLHSVGILHRDLKGELRKEHGRDGKLEIAIFGKGV